MEDRKKTKKKPKDKKAKKKWKDVDAYVIPSGALNSLGGAIRFQ